MNADESYYIPFEENKEEIDYDDDDYDGRLYFYSKIYK